MITQMELAKLAGVSQKTVNRALSAHADVSEMTRRRIKALADQHGYLPNQAAQIIRSGRSGNIGMVIPEDIFATFMPVELIGSLKKSLEPHQLMLLLACLSDRELTDENIVCDILRRMMCDGLLINYNFNYPKRMMELLARYRLPAIWLNTRLDSDCVYHDEFNAGAVATRHLLEAGHRRIVYLNTCDLVHHSRRDRRDGYVREMRAAGLEPEIHEIEKISDRERFERIFAILSAADRPTAVLACETDIKILVAVTARLRLRMPDYLSLVTFDLRSRDFLNSELTLMTTMIQQEEKLCQVAIENLLCKIAAPEAILPAVRIPLLLASGYSVKTIK